MLAITFLQCYYIVRMLVTTYNRSYNVTYDFFILLVTTYNHSFNVITSLYSKLLHTWAGALV